MKTLNLKSYWLPIMLLLTLLAGIGCSAGGAPGALEPTANPNAGETPTPESGSENVADNLAGTHWVLTGMNPDAGAVALLPDNPIDIEFQNGQAAGTAGCNHYFTSYTLPAAGELSIGQAGSTMMACAEDVMAQETQFLTALQAAKSFTLTAETLTIFYEGGSLQFAPVVAAPDQPLENTSWQLTTFISGDAASSLLVNTEITAQFNAGQVAGSAGCNQYFGSYEINDAAITFSPLGSTRMACAAEIMQQEGAFLAALQSASSFQIEGDELTVQHDGGWLVFQAGSPTEAEETDAISWEEALTILNSGEVASLFQAHSLSVTLTLKDGRSLRTIEPTIDAIFAAVTACGEPCANIVLATE